MSATEDNRKLLNSLVDMGYTAEIPGCFGMSALLRWGEAETTCEVIDEIGNFKVVNEIFPKLLQQDWYIFEIGRNCGTVFSADCVKSIEISGKHAKIHLKG